MKKIIIPLLGFFLAILISCQKEIDWNAGGGGTTAAGQKLVMVKSITGADTSQVEYYYDASGRLIREKTTGMSAGVDLGNELTVNRNASGIITTTVQKAAAMIMAGIDSIVTRYYYSTATSKYTAGAFDLGLPGFAVTDSVVYTYDASGRISKDEHYLTIGGSPIPLPPVMVLRNVYTYSADGKNLVSMSIEGAVPPATTLSPVSVQTFTADTKVNPLILLNEAIVLGRISQYSANNATKLSLTNTIDPSQDFNMDFTYTYNTDNKPDSSYGTRTPGGAVTAAKYFYQ